MKKQKKGAKKKFFPVETQFTSAKVNLYAYAPEDLNGNVIRLDLTKALRGKSFELRLKVNEKNGSLTTSPLSLQLFQGYVKRAVRKGTDYVEDSFETKSKDNILRIKPLLITRKRVSRNVLKALRELTQKTISAHCQIRDSKEIFDEIITNKLQKILSIKLKKIYPLALCEIRAIHILENNQKKIPEVHKKEEERTEHGKVIEEPKKAKSKKPAESEDKKENKEISQDSEEQ